MKKIELLKKVKEELKNVGYFDILAVINILIDELKNELINTKEINIPNFGVFKLKTFNPKMIPNVRTGEMKLTKPYTKLRLVISKKIIKYLKGTDKSEKNAAEKI